MRFALIFIRNIQTGAAAKPPPHRRVFLQSELL
jgi:hypothetical protein